MASRLPWIYEQWKVNATHYATTRQNRLDNPIKKCCWSIPYFSGYALEILFINEIKRAIIKTRLEKQDWESGLGKSYFMTGSSAPMQGWRMTRRPHPRLFKTYSTCQKRSKPCL
eukprot:2236449-Amphidinium_carterae.1